MLGLVCIVVVLFLPGGLMDLPRVPARIRAWLARSRFGAPQGGARLTPAMAAEEGVSVGAALAEEDYAEPAYRGAGDDEAGGDPLAPTAASGLDEKGGPR